MDKNLVGGSSNMMILSLVSRKDMYGYEIIKELDLLSKTIFQFKEGTLYPILYRLEKNGFLKSYMKLADNGKERRYYQITVSGQNQLSAEKKQWELFKNSVGDVLGGFKYGNEF